MVRPSAGLLIGGVVAAPIAAYLVRHVPGRLLGASVGGIIVVTNARTLINAFEIDGDAAAGDLRGRLHRLGAAIALGLGLPRPAQGPPRGAAPHATSGSGSVTA